MKTTRTTRAKAILKAIQEAPEGGIVNALRDLRKTKEPPREKVLPGFYCRSEDPKDKRIFWRRAAAVQAAYDNAPPGAEAITAAVWRKLQSFRPKLKAWDLECLISSKFRIDVTTLLYRKTTAIRALENKAVQDADDARRAARMGRKGATHG